MLKRSPSCRDCTYPLSISNRFVISFGVASETPIDSDYTNLVLERHDVLHGNVF